jgi:hypothetical protein
MVKISNSKSVKNGTMREGSVTLGQEELIKRDREALERLTAQFLARKFPLYEAGRNVVGFLDGMVSYAITERITDLLRGHTREMQGEIADSIRIYILFQEIDLTGVRHVDDELEKIFEMYDNLLTS